MSDDQKENPKKEPAGALKSKWHPREFFDSIIGTDRYKNLKMRIILLDGLLSLVPLFIVVTISYFWFQQILKDDFRNQLKWEIQNNKQSIELFLEERLSMLRFVTSTTTYAQLSDQKALTDIFTKFKREFPGLVDFGVIDASGIQHAYAGPYNLEGKDYSNQDWFNEIVIRSSYVSDVFMGYRKIPHFAIAVKKEVPERGTFWVLRVTIDMETLTKYASNIKTQEGDDVFIVNHAGVLQTPSRLHGNVLEKFKGSLPPSGQEVSVRDVKQGEGDDGFYGYASIENSPWVLVAVISSTPFAKIPNIFRNELFYITIFSILISLMVTYLLTQTVVNRIRRADQEREAAIIEIEHANKMASIGRLAAGVAHEINNPLAIINEKAGLMKDIIETSEDLAKNKDKFMNLLTGIFESVNRSRTVTHRLLGFSRRMDLGHDSIDLNDAVKEVIEFLEKEILHRNISLKLNLKENLPKVITDKGQAQQVFLNIINNAIDAVEEGGQIEISSQLVDDDTIRLSVRDNGIGIPRDKLKYIFEPFYTTKAKGKGTGLGLSISYGIIQKLGGTMHVESEPYKGTIFKIELPLRTKAG